MTDKEKFINLLEEFDIHRVESFENDGYNMFFGNDINLTPSRIEQIKITGAPWASATFHFNKAGFFETVEISGD